MAHAVARDGVSGAKALFGAEIGEQLAAERRLDRNWDERSVGIVPDYPGHRPATEAAVGVVQDDDGAQLGSRHIVVTFWLPSGVEKLPTGLKPTRSYRRSLAGLLDSR